jgi:hypothetical protein
LTVEAETHVISQELAQHVRACGLATLCPVESRQPAGIAATQYLGSLNPMMHAMVKSGAPHDFAYLDAGMVPHAPGEATSHPSLDDGCATLHEGW